MVVFYRCNDYLIYLKTIEDNYTSENKQSLNGISQSQKIHAKYFTDKLKVIDIEHLWTIDEITGLYVKIDEISDDRFIYKIGEMAKVKGTHDDVFCYYLDKDVARFCDKSPLRDHFDGEIIQYYMNGMIYKKYNCVNKIKEGKYEKYHKNGVLKIKRTFFNGEKTNDYFKYRKNGMLSKHKTYFKGRKENCKKYFKNGNISIDMDFFESDITYCVTYNEITGKKLMEIQYLNGYPATYYDVTYSKDGTEMYTETY